MKILFSTKLIVCLSAGYAALFADPASSFTISPKAKFSTFTHPTSLSATTQRDLDRSTLPHFFRDVEILGNAEEFLPQYRTIHASMKLADQQTVDVGVPSSPILLADTDVKQTYQSNNFAAIKDLEAKANADLQAVYTNVGTNGNQAWTKVQSGGKQFYMSWSDSGSMWAMTESIKPQITSDTNDVSYQATVQVGSYTANARVAGIQQYNLNLPTLLVESVLALIVAKAVSGIVADGLGFLVARFSLYLTQAAAEAGLESFSFAISESMIASVATGLVFAVVFIGLVFLFDWLNRKYTLRLQVFNWDGNNDWYSGTQAVRNAKIPGQNESWQQFKLPKAIPPNSVVTPPGFSPVQALEAVTYYAVVIWENDNTFMEGLATAIQMKKGSSDSTQGFMWAYELPRFEDNMQAVQNGVGNTDIYVDSANWNNNPTKFTTTVTDTNIPVTASCDLLSGASDGLYNAIIHINA